MVRLIILHVFILLVFVKGNDDIATQKRTKTIERFRSYVQRLNISALPNDIGKRLKDLTNIPLNVAVTGDSGAGKSSLINTLRNLAANDPKAAAVGVVEKTTEIRAYVDTEKSQLVYWDLPGCGTPAFPRESYLKKVDFDKYDFFFIVSSDRFTENDAWLAQEITKRKKNFYFIRNKIDIDVQNEKRDHPTRNENEILDEIRKNCEQYLPSITTMEKRIYLISSVLAEKSKWDFKRLVDDSIRNTLRLKQEVLIDQLTSFSKQQIKERAEELRSGILWYSFKGGLVELIPMFSVSLLHQIYLIEEKMTIYKRNLLLDEEWLLSLITSKPSHFEMITSRFFKFQNIQYYIVQLGCHIVLYITKNFLLCMFGDPKLNTTLNSWEQFFAPQSIIFQLLSASITFGMIYHRLSSLIYQLETSALYLIYYFA